MIWPLRRPALALPDAASHARRDALAAAPAIDADAPLDTLRWCVVDVETGGLDAARDPLLAIGALAVERGRIVLAAGVEAGLAQTQPSAAANILVHGIGEHAQTHGLPPHQALLDWLEFARGAPRVAFHAGFDRAVLERETRARLDLRPPEPWFDAAVVAALLFPQAAPQCRHLDDWLAHFGIVAYARHDALADAYATAELWLVLLAALRRENIASVRTLRRLLRGRRWLGAN